MHNKPFQQQLEKANCFQFTWYGRACMQVKQARETSSDKKLEATIKIKLFDLKEPKIACFNLAGRTNIIIIKPNLFQLPKV